MVDQPQPQCAPGLVDGHPDGRLVAPSALRNERPIIETLTPLLSGRNGMVLEIGSGTGQHSAALAAAFPRLVWQPSDPFDNHLDSCRAWVAHAGCPNLRDPIWLDAAEPWPDLDPLAGVISANVIHISPWVVAMGIMRGAGQTVAPGGLLLFYGPFREGGAHTGNGNARFDASLRAQDPDWGIRDAEAVIEEAELHGFRYPEIIEMPANNRILALTRT
ncbi:MAG: DUF938 domain-containing protein [Pseudomonadota bacterium]